MGAADNVKRIHSKIIFVTIPVLLLAATVTMSFVITEDVFAKDGRYSGDTSQAAAVDNECLNPILDSNTIDNIVDVGNCAGTVSQQDESGSASAPITSQTANPTIELQRATTTTPPPGLGAPMTCEECFDILSAAQETAVEQLLAGPTNPLDSPIWGPNAPTTIEELCQIWAKFSPEQRGSSEVQGDITVLLERGGVTQPTLDEVIRCLNASPFAPAG
jgi:hypothetical protein